MLSAFSWMGVYDGFGGREMRCGEAPLGAAKPGGRAGFVIALDGADDVGGGDQGHAAREGGGDFEF